MSKKQKPYIDKHTKAAMQVASSMYFVVTEFSGNENPGLLVGTEVMKHSNPVPKESKYWDGLYWTSIVVCPNGETRKVCCDVLKPRKTDKYFKRQKRLFVQIS